MFSFCAGLSGVSSNFQALKLRLVARADYQRLAGDSSFSLEPTVWKEMTVGLLGCSRDCSRREFRVEMR